MRILIIGLGSIGKRHAEIFSKEYSDFEIFALRSENKEDADNIQNVKFVYDEDEAFSYKPDIVFVTNPTCLHIDMALIAAKNRCNLFLEKPLSNNLENIDELITLVKENKLITLMGCNMRYNPIVLDIKKYVDEKLFGEVLSFNIKCGSYLPDWRPTQDYTKSYSASKKMGGGVVLDLIHEIDYAKWIFGDFIDFKSIVGKISDLEIDTEDYADIIVKTNKNISGMIHLDYYRKISERKIEVVFQNGILIGDLINNNLTLLTKERNETITYNFQRNYMYEEQLKYFVSCIIDNKQTFNDVQEGYNTLKLALKIKENGLI